MDRFIGRRKKFNTACKGSLKSNMDRFIVKSCYISNIRVGNLKSNMDRFIEHLQEFQ